MRTAALIVAAGRGSRMGAVGAPKQYLEIAGKTVLSHTLGKFDLHPEIDLVQVVIHADDHDLYAASVGGVGAKLAAPVDGGATRQISVARGLEALAASGCDSVLVHDAARPFVSPAAISAVIAALGSGKSAIAAQPVTDTIKRAGARQSIAATVDRDGLWRAQTPQGFDLQAILAAHRRAAAIGRSDFTDDAALAEWAGIEVALVPVPGHNMKITTPEDVSLARALLGERREAVETRIGNGFDVHRFTEGDHVWLCGVRIPHNASLEGHSDADVGLHALTDALLGAIGDGDIGQHFPPSDPQWKGAASHLFLADAGRRVRERNGRIVNCDVTLLCEAPKVAPHRDAMRKRIADILGIDVGRVGVKATTTEQLGFTGRREGIAAMAVASVALAP
jgi:2-C-methyl-D-erythritol 4-phosphate cytidylyltransferase/2-C-methyl-D-erythritol 2,4-cyclodiphosphate synthase